jgi:hypothetical protein
VKEIKCFINKVKAITLMDRSQYPNHSSSAATRRSYWSTAMVDGGGTKAGEEENEESGSSERKRDKHGAFLTPSGSCKASTSRHVHMHIACKENSIRT